MTISTSGVYERARASGSRIVLFVDDYVDSCLIYTEAMFALGAELEMSHDGVEGIAKARALLPDAIVMDLSLPGSEREANLMSGKHHLSFFTLYTVSPSRTMP